MSTFGTLVDGDTTEPANTDRAFVGLYNCPVLANITAINARYAADTGTENAKAVIYTDNSGTPGTLLAVGGSTAVAGGDVSHAISIAVTAGNYWIGTTVDSFQYGWRYLGGGAGSIATSDSVTFTSPPSNFPGPTVTGNLGSVYATYTAATAPVISTQPANTGALENDRAVFTVAATASSGGLTYQWKDNRSGSMANITDAAATSAIYVTASTRLQQTGRQVQCVVTDSNGSTTSSTATLTVGRYPDTQPPRKRGRHGGLSMELNILEWW